MDSIVSNIENIIFQVRLSEGSREYFLRLVTEAKSFTR